MSRRSGIEVSSLYFAAPRPMIERDGHLLMVDDERLKPGPGRGGARALGAVPDPRLLPAVGRDREPGARRVAELIEEMRTGRQSERQGRLIDRDGTASMERKKREGYF